MQIRHPPIVPQLEDLEVTIADHIQKVMKLNFEAAWDEVGDEFQKEETFTLSTIKTLEGKCWGCRFWFACLSRPWATVEVFLPPASPPPSPEDPGPSLEHTVQIHKIIKTSDTQSHLMLCNPMNDTVHGILQTRILEWGAFPFSRGSSQPRDRTQVSHPAGGFFTS